MVSHTLKIFELNHMVTSHLTFKYIEPTCKTLRQTVPVALSENVNLQDLSHYEKQIMRLSFGR